MRVNKYLAQATGMSRRRADDAVASGRVSINSVPATAGQQVAEGDQVALDNKIITLSIKYLTILMNKPVGYVCSRDGQGSKTIYDLLPKELHILKPVGRLDKDSSGLLLLTNDGKMAHELTHPKFQKLKKYKIALNIDLPEADFELITKHGVMLEDGISKFGLGNINNQRKEWTVSMREGRNRQIRRTFETLGYKVVKLHRTHLGPHGLDSLGIGKYSILNMSAVKLVGVLNITPDSFSDGGLFIDSKKALARADQLFADGASIVDIGGESTNPWSTPVTPNEEWQRIKDVVGVLISKYPGKISIDSHHPETLSRSAEIGPFIINDVTGCNNPEMIAVAAELQLPIIVSHLPAKFGTDIMAAHKSAEPLTAIDDVKAELLEREAELINADVKPENIILDPGIGFGKTMELNAQLVEFAKEVPDKAVMIGYSRKRFLGENRMELGPNLEAGKHAIASGAQYLRVHDVKGHKQLLV